MQLTESVLLLRTSLKKCVKILMRKVYVFGVIVLVLLGKYVCRVVKICPYNCGGPERNPTLGSSCKNSSSRSQQLWGPEMDGLHIGVMKEILLDAVPERFSKFRVSQNGGDHKSLISLHIYDHSFQTFRTCSQKRNQGQPCIYSKSGAQEFCPSMMVLKSFSTIFPPKIASPTGTSSGAWLTTCRSHGAAQAPGQAPARPTSPRRGVPAHGRHGPPPSTPFPDLGVERWDGIGL